MKKVICPFTWKQVYRILNQSSVSVRLMQHILLAAIISCRCTESPNTRDCLLSSGMDSVWECRGMSLETFFLCESCEEILSRREICRHMVTHDHQLKYTVCVYHCTANLSNTCWSHIFTRNDVHIFQWKKHPEFLQMFWFEEDLLLEMKMDILKDVVELLSKRERVNVVDAQVPC